MDRSKSSGPHIPVAPVLDLADFGYRFAAVERKTFLPDGVTPETDATHTVILQLLAVAIAHEYLPHLDVGKVALYGLVHDLLEGYAGDTPTDRITAHGRQIKEEREAEALAQVKARFGIEWPFLVTILEEYEAQESAEARFVKMLDKLMPVISHIFNHGAVPRQEGQTLEESRALFKEHTKRYMSLHFGQDNPQLMTLRKALRSLFEQAAFDV